MKCRISVFALNICSFLPVNSARSLKEHFLQKLNLNLFIEIVHYLNDIQTMNVKPNYAETYFQLKYAASGVFEEMYNNAVKQLVSCLLVKNTEAIITFVPSAGLEPAISVMGDRSLIH